MPLVVQTQCWLKLESFIHLPAGQWASLWLTTFVPSAQQQRTPASEPNSRFSNVEFTSHLPGWRDSRSHGGSVSWCKDTHMSQYTKR